MSQYAMAAARDDTVAPPDPALAYVEHAAFIRSLLARFLGPGADVDDLVQEVFLVALRRPQKLYGDARAWLCGVALKLAAATRRRARMRQFLGLEAAEAIPDRRTPDRIFEADEDSRLLYALLERLSEKKRTVFILIELQGFTGPEAARLLGCPLTTVRTRLHQARRELAALLPPASPEAEANRGGGER